MFPKEGQSAEQQSEDEAACYNRAVGNTGSDPFELADQQSADQQQAQADQREQATTQQLKNFKKAFGVCLEAKDYMVK